MAPHSSTLAWKIPWMEEPGRLQSMGLLSRTRLSDFTFTFHFHALEKDVATDSRVLAWRIPGTGEPSGLQLWGRTASDMTEATQQQHNEIREQRNHVLNISVAICQVQHNLDQLENVLCNHHVIKLKIKSTEAIITKTTTQKFKIHLEIII